MDFAELALVNKGEYYVLNLGNVNFSKFSVKIKEYFKKNRYEYFIVENSLANKELISDIKKTGVAIRIFDGFTDEARDVVNWFGGGGQNSYGTVPWFTGGWKNIFKLENNGPQIFIFKL